MKLTCFRISNGALAVKDLPERIKVLNWGDNPNTKDKPVRVTERTLRALALQANVGFGTVALDYEHNTVPGSPEFLRSSEPRKVGGYGRVEGVPNDGIYLVMDAYTPSGTDNAKEFIDLSPAVKTDPKTGEVVFLHSVALCRHGSIDDLHFYNTNQEDPVEEMMKLIEELTKQVAALTARVDEMAKASTTVPAPVDALSVKLAALEQNLVTLSTDWAADQAKREKAIMLDLAARDGKVVALSAEAVSKLSVSDLAAHIAALNPTVPLDRRTPPAQGTGGHGTSLIEQFNAIADPVERSAFYRQHRDAILAIA